MIVVENSWVKQMEQYQEFLNRISSFELPVLSLGEGDFIPSASVKSKVREDNRFSAFYGDTVVFDLADAEKVIINHIVNKLYQAAPECFSERLIDSTFHMTLHDLSNSPVLNEVADAMKTNEAKLRDKLVASPIPYQTIQMQSKAIFNMVNTSLVMGLYPVNEQEYDKLMQLYQLVDEVQELPYPLTPHITLAYYHRNGFGQNSAKKLEDIINSLNQEKLYVTLHTSRLVYQHFTSMNEYRTQFHL